MISACQKQAAYLDSQQDISDAERCRTDTSFHLGPVLSRTPLVSIKCMEYSPLTLTII
jgi:hypothetical protein